MLAADVFGLPVARVSVELGDSFSALCGPAGGGSAVSYVLGTAVAAAAAAARRQLPEVASDVLEAAVDDLEVADGAVRVRGVPQRGMTPRCRTSAAPSSPRS